jgi:hypothetical protein
MKTFVLQALETLASGLYRARLVAVALCLVVPVAAVAGGPFASGLEGSVGSTIGPDRALYVAEGAAGRISRVDLKTGKVTPFATGLPAGNPAIGLGGPIDLVFVGHKAYVLVTLVGPAVGGSAVDGIYRIDGPKKHKVIADIGTWATNHPPPTAFDLPNGVQYSIESYQGGFLVSDGHHNRVVQVLPKGPYKGPQKALDKTWMRTFKQFGNIAPTGLEPWAQLVLMAEAGPVPHTPETGKIVLFGRHTPALEVASGAPLLVDVEFGPGRRLFALAQGDFPPPPYPPAGAPALPNTGSLVETDGDTGGFRVLADGINLPSSLEIVGHTAYVVTLTGEVWRFRNITKSPW